LNTKHLFIKAIGRSGSTLLQRVLNQVPGVLIRGENYAAFNKLRECYELMSDAESVKNKASTDEHTKNAWDNWLDRDRVLMATRQLMETILDPTFEQHVVGYKEIRFGATDMPGLYNCYEGLDQQVDFENAVFPDARHIFLYRDTEELLQSAWWAKNKKMAEMTINTQLESMRRTARSRPESCCMIDYGSIKNKDGLRSLFDWLEEPFCDSYADPLEHITGATPR